jgi:glycosyltransferase involved in cell wall biosynthesis
MPQLTVGLPLRNSSQYLHHTIESVQSQTFTDWTLLAIDDASNDNTAEIVRGFAEQDGRIQLVQFGPNAVSQAENWNRAIQLAQTQYVSMFGHDDIMMPDLLARQIQMMNDNPSMVMVFAQGPLIDENGELLRSRRGNPMMQPNWSEDRVLGRNDLGPLLICEGFVHPSSVMLRTTIAQSIALFRQDLPLFLDIEYWSRIGDCGPVGYIAGDLLRYRLRPQSALARAMEAGINFSDAHRLYTLMMEHWSWDASKQATFKKHYFLAHASRALRAAEMAWETSDFKTTRRQVAICLSLVEMAHSNPQDWIARWLNIRYFGKHFDSNFRLHLLSRICSLPLLKRTIRQYYISPMRSLQPPLQRESR